MLSKEKVNRMFDMNSKVNKRTKKLKNRRKRMLQRKRKQSLSDPTAAEGEVAATPQTIPPMINWPSAANCAQFSTSIKEWQYKHEIAYWRSKAEALNYENKILHTIVDNIYLQNNSHNTENTEKSNCIDEDEEDYEDEQEVDIEKDEEFMHFLQASEQHKMKRDKAKNETIQQEKTLPPSKPVDSERLEERLRLYGESATLVNGLETKLQLNFDCYKDLHKPYMWPTIPLNI